MEKCIDLQDSVIQTVPLLTSRHSQQVDSCPFLVLKLSSIFSKWQQQGLRVMLWSYNVATIRRTAKGERETESECSVAVGYIRSQG